MSEYYDGTAIVIMLPIRVVYHEPTGVVFSYEKPNLKEIETALRTAINSPPAVWQDKKDKTNER